MPKKPSPKQSETARNNGRKSRGPKTTEGKAAASRNALKHGLVARNILITHGDTADKPAEFDRLLNALLEDFNPATTAERLIVERIAAAYWRLRRAYRYEAKTIAWAVKAAQTPPDLPFIPFKPPAKEQLPVIPRIGDIQALARYEGMINAELNRTLIQLERIRDATRDREQDPQAPTDPPPSDPPPADEPPSNQPPSDRPATPDHRHHPDQPADHPHPRTDPAP